MHTVEEVRAYSQELRLLLRYLGITTGDMEKGAMRFEANVSMRENETAPLGTRVEIKNLNSIHSMERAIEYELKRQQRILEQGGKVSQETLGWNEVQGKTFSQRSKEEAHDYRYFPEPDLPPLIVDQTWIDAVTQNMPELPVEKRARYQLEFSLPADKADALIQDKATGLFFEQTAAVAQDISASVIANGYWGTFLAG
jgi:aspartyl-tRNA(Asn)/glutamyl-tRNA(Gln) amidotransferase subunit B